MPAMTNVLKAQIIVALNAILGVVTVMGVGLTEAQTGAIGVAANAILGLWVGLTYQQSPARIPGGVMDTGQHVELIGTPPGPVEVKVE